MKISLSMVYTKNVVIDLPSDETQEEVDFVLQGLTPDQDGNYNEYLENTILRLAEEQDKRVPALWYYDVKHVETDKQLLARLEEERKRREDAINKLPF